MKYSSALLLIAISFSLVAHAQKKPPKIYKFGVKGGYNIATIAGADAPNFHPDNKSGFMVAGFFSPGGTSGFGYRTELVFSRQGFSYDSSGNKMNVRQDYIYLPQLTTFTIARVVQLQAGVQLGYLLNAKKSKDSSGAREYDIIEAYNRLDYGFAAGVELYPYKNIILGARYNISFGSMYERQQSQPLPSPLPFDPSEVNGKNAVIQFFAGLRF